MYDDDDHDSDNGWRPKIRRIARIVKYSLLIAAGICATFWQSQLVNDQVSGWVNYAWAISMVVSATICLYGPITDKWIGEYVGLPLLLSVVGLYGLSAVAGAKAGGNLVLLAYGLVVIAFTFSLLARWQDLNDVKHYSSHARETQTGE